MKRIAIFFDGTWDDGGNKEDLTKTNVVKLHAAAKNFDDNGVEQVAIYIKGIGTDANLSSKRNWIKGVFGVEVVDRIQDGYSRLAEVYVPGDEIYLFGFSRGAFEARSLAGFIATAGVLPPDQLDRLSDAWQCYVDGRSGRAQQKLAAVRAASDYPVRTKCVGVWDTVGNLGVPLAKGLAYNKRLGFFDTKLSDHVDVALHALSIDERRGPFSPTLWTLKKGQTPGPKQIIEQVWFAGSHCDVGGGFETADLSDLALVWMAERVSQTTGFAFALDPAVNPDPLGLQHDSQQGPFFRMGRKIPYVRLIKQNKKGLPFWRRVLFGGWRSNQLPRGQYSVNETVHESARARFGESVNIQPSNDESAPANRATYQPRALAVVIRK